jgi:ABC-2 type transport system ATP-binding protein
MLARVLAGVDRPDSGSVTEPRTATFLLPERAAVLPGCSAHTLAASLARTIAAGETDWRRRLDDALEHLRSTHDSRTSLSRLSKGNLQKAYLAVGFALRPALAVLDEPMTGLDPEAMGAAGALIRELATDGSVVVVTAHRPVRIGDPNRLLTAGRLADPTPRAAVTYLVDLDPSEVARVLLRVGLLGPDVLDDGGVSTAAAEDRARFRVGADGLAVLLRTALAHGIRVTRVVEDTGW